MESDCEHYQELNSDLILKDLKEIFDLQDAATFLYLDKRIRYTGQHWICIDVPIANEEYHSKEN
jgi:hypothetical protein